MSRSGPPPSLQPSSSPPRYPDDALDEMDLDPVGARRDDDDEWDDDDDDVAEVPASPSEHGDTHHAPQDDPDDDANDDDADSMHHATAPKHTYPHLREIGHLASWTVSSHKQRCGVHELRSPSIHQFWQSDGPQPHSLTIHFFKRVNICHMRLHVDHDLDESYTPTRIQIWAGTAHHDLQLVTDMPLEAPKGWLDIDLSAAGGPSEFADGDDLDEQAALDSFGVEASGLPEQVLQRRRRKLMLGRGPTLRCFIVQVRILENHQNGKDTHLRGFQVFAKDHEASGRRRAAVQLRELEQQDTPESAPVVATRKTNGKGKRSSRQDATIAGIKEADWMGELTIR